MTKRLNEKVMVITGAAQGIGRGCAQMAAREGAYVVIGDIQKEAGEATAAAIRAAGGQAVFQTTKVVNDTERAALTISAPSMVFKGCPTFLPIRLPKGAYCL